MEQDFFNQLEPTKPAKRPPVGTPLSPRQKDIVRLIAEGKRNRDIATALNLSEGTVKMYISTEIFPRLGVRNRAGVAVAFYRQLASASCECGRVRILA